jgi:hypothetical protein
MGGGEAVRWRRAGPCRPAGLGRVLGALARRSSMIGAHQVWPSNLDCSRLARLARELVGHLIRSISKHLILYFLRH